VTGNETRPLSGRRVLVTRPREQAAELVERLTALGAEAIEAPLIRILPPEDPRPLQRAAAEPQVFDWIVFTSANAVDAFMGAFFTRTEDGRPRDVRALNGPVLCAVGAATSARLAHYGLTADLVPGEFRAEAVADAIVQHGPIDGTRVLLPRSDIGREVVADRLRGAGARVTDVVAYRTVPADRADDAGSEVHQMLLEGRIDAVTFTSASAVRSFAERYGTGEAAELLRRTVVAVIGPVTAEAAARIGIPVHVQPSTYTVAALADALAAHMMVTRPPGT
jgi:uroporphyrinogen III methyltransferase / synthase